MPADEALPQHESITSCPKCAAPAGRLGVTYHACAEPFGSWACRDTQLLEHLCRVCERCGYGWCEAVVTPGDEQ